MRKFRYALRRIVRRPSLSVTVIVMLAVGIGAATAIFSLFHQVLVQPLPVQEPHRLVNVSWTSPDRPAPTEAVSYSMFRDLEAEQLVFTDVAAQTFFSANLALGDSGALKVETVAVSGSYFRTLNLEPALGRLIGPQDEPRVNEAPVVVLSHDLWESRFGSDADIVGRVLRINGQPLTVVGIAPPRFTGTRLGVRAQLFVPLTMRWQLDPSMPRAAIDNRNFNLMFLFARLRPDVTAERASAQINTVYQRILREIEAPLRSIPEDEMQRFLDKQLQLAPGARGQGVIPGAAQSLTLLLGVTLIVLLIVCVNVANLLLVRGVSRAGEMAIRESIGATRGQLITQLTTETAVPAVLGGVLSLPVSAVILAAIARILPSSLTDAFAIQIGSAAVLFAVFATVSTTIAVGLFPAVHMARTSPAARLRGHAAQALGSLGAVRIRNALVIAQIAFSLVLLVLAGLFAKSLHNVARIDLGLNVNSLVSFSISPRSSGYSDDQTAALYARIEEELAAQPGVSSVAFAAIPLMSGRSYQSQYFLDGQNQSEPSLANFNLVGPAFFNTLSIPLLAGREFTSEDAIGTPRVVIVNQRLARRYGLGDAAVGEYVSFALGAPRFEIVGVAADAAYSEVKSDNTPTFFLPHISSGYANPVFNFVLGSPSVYVRAGIDLDILERNIPDVVANIDPTLPVTELTTMRRQTQEQIFVDRLVTILSASFAGLATLLAAIGLYSVLSYNMTQRVRELGLRIALGAEPGNLRMMVLKQVAMLAAIGIALGLAGAISVSQSAESLLYGLSGYDPFVLAGAIAVLGTVVFVASYVPAWRASMVPPMEALRDE